MWALENAALPVLVFELLVKSLLLLAVVLSLTWFLRRSSAAIRHLYFTVASLALVVLPLASVLLPSWHPGVVPDRFGSMFVSTSVTSITQTEGVPEAAVDSRAGHAAEKPAPKSWPFWFFIIWLVGAAILLAGLIAGKLYGFLTARKARAVEDEDFLGALDDVARRVGLKRKIVVLESDRFKVPCVTGIMRPKLLVPPQTVFWPRDRLFAVLHHELSHIKRSDILAQFFAQVACCLYWLNPLAWITERKLFIERERACDDIALGQDVKASDYAGHLMEVLEEMGNLRNTLWVTAAMAEGTDFKDRILSVLNPAAKRTAPRRAHLVAAVVVALLAVLPLSALHPWTTEAAQIDRQARTPVTEAQPERDDGSSDVSTRDDRVYIRETRGLPLSILIDQLKDRSARIRERAAVALGESGDRRAVLPLIEALDDRDAGVREHAATALGKLEDKRAVPKLCAVLLDDSSPLAREHAATALGAIGDDRAYQPLVNAMQSDPDSEVREHALSALRRLRDGR